MVRHIATVALLAAAPALAQSAPAVRPSLYAGAGLGTNLGGTVGIGTEVRIGPFASISGAVGAYEDDPLDGDRGTLVTGYDLGVKMYPFREGLYAGLNYGFVDATIVGIREGKPVLETTNAFSLTVGVRTRAQKGLYASGYLGVTTNGSANMGSLPLGGDVFVPRIGALVGVGF